MESVKYGIIYKITNKVNGKIYIGQTIQKKGFKDRYEAKGIGIERVYNYYNNQIKYGALYNKHLYSAIQKYGFENFDIVEEFEIAYSKKELDKKEIYWIHSYSSCNKKYGYNIKIGGEGGGYTTRGYFEYAMKMARPIRCLTDKKVYISLRETSEEYNISTKVIANCCKENQKKCKSRDTKVEYEFEYYKSNWAVVCLNTYEVFKNAVQGGKKYNLSNNRIISCCHGDSPNAGKDPTTGEKLVWKKLIDCYENTLI